MSTATESKHTTSPWIVECGKGFSGENWLVCTVGRSSEDDLDYYVTTDHVHASELSGDAKYDARLIAAAPAMLEALEGLVAQVEEKDNPSDEGLSSHDDSVIMAKSAIRLAKGESQ